MERATTARASNKRYFIVNIIVIQLIRLMTKTKAKKEHNKEEEKSNASAPVKNNKQKKGKNKHQKLLVRQLSQASDLPLQSKRGDSQEGKEIADIKHQINDNKQKNHKHKPQHHGAEHHHNKNNHSKHGKDNPDNQKFIKWQQIGKHDHKDDVWIVIEENVYNVTKFVDEHPGGAKVIMMRAGKNATNAFFKADHPYKVLQKMLPKYIVGALDPQSMIESWQRETKTGKMDRFVAAFLSVVMLLFMIYLAL